MNEEETLSETLRSVQAQPGDKEIIVVDGGSSDKTLAIARTNGCKTIQSDPGRGAQLNSGAEFASYEILLFLHADTLLPIDASKEIVSILETRGVIAGSFRLRFNPSSPVLRFYSLCTAINHSLFTFGDQSLFLYRSTFHFIDKFQSYPFLEDVEFQSRLRRSGRFLKSNLSVVTSSRRFNKHGPIRQQLVNLCIVIAFLGGIRPHVLARFYSNAR